MTELLHDGVESMASLAYAEPPGAGTQSERKCVLIVEDNPLNMKLFSAMISAQGYDVLEANDGIAGLELAQTLRPDLIVMDLQLPGMSGLDVTLTLKADAETQYIPIIATTAFAQFGDEDKIRASGCDAYMAKPIAINEFLALIDRLIARAAIAALTAEFVA